MYKWLSKILELLEQAYWFIKRKELLRQLADVGNNVYISPHWSCPCPKCVHIGHDVYIGKNVCLSSDISHIYIGNHVMFGPNVHIHGGDHRHDIVGRWMNTIKINEKRLGVDDKDVHIEDDVWIGDSAIILKGVTVSRGSIIGAGAIISKSTAPYDIVVGVNKVVGKRFTPEQIAEHERILKNNVRSCFTKQ